MDNPNFPHQDPTPDTPINEIYEVIGVPSTGNGFIELPYDEEIKFNYTHKKPDGYFHVTLRHSYSPVFIFFFHRKAS